MEEEKKSFFEKITGTKSVNQETSQSQPILTSIPHDTPKPQEEMQPASHKIEIEQEDTKDKKDWITDDAEGQLVLDVYQTDNEIVVKSTLAGVKPEDIDISITNDMLTIKGVREKDEEVKDENYYYQECYWGVFSRSVILPSEVEEDKIKASLKNGILTIRMPKAEKIKTKKISVIEE